MLKKLLRGDCSFIKIHIAVKGRQKEEHLRFCNTEIIWLDPDKLKRTAQAKDWPFCNSEVLGMPSLVVFARLQRKPPYYNFLSLFSLNQQGKWAFKIRSFLITHTIDCLTTTH